ncbi:AAA family ATPase [Methylorubrum rhodesianum]|uniref:AAA family ATPase n=1 Tax=Methylorubrum rhodesianum TaxID=29427 RepID=A0ABU9ZGI8_9HYPH|nr:AAA family ATPase [Methylorubrum rhodesianum]
MAGATILLGLGLASRAGLIERIEGAAPVVIVEVPQVDWIDPMAEALVACFGPTSSPTGHSRKDLPARAPDAVVVTPAARSILPDDRSTSRAAQAFREHRPLIGVTTRMRGGLPGDLLRACEERLVVGDFDPGSVAVLIEHVAGERAGRSIGDAAAAAIEPGDLRVAINPARGADGCVDRLAAVLEARLLRRRAADGPRLQDLAGYGPAAEWGLAAAADLAAYARNALPWAACEPGALLVGQPGTGKTSFAQALACQAGVPLLAGSLAQWQSAGEAHLGTTLKAMRDFFDAARKASPCVALIDELDSFGDRRRFAGHNREYSVQVVNGLLECLDGAGGRAGVLLVGTSNDRDRIDPAILRSGRFDRCIAIPLPSISDLAAILRHHLGEDLGDADLEDAAKSAFGGTGADCAAWVRRARSRARRAGRPLAIGDLIHEIGAAEGSSGDEDPRAAVHECGHAVVAHALGFELTTVALNRAGEGGMTSLRARGRYATREGLRDLLAVCLAGRAAEILVFGAPSTGAAADLAEASAIGSHMHCSWGLGSRIAVCPSTSMPEDVSAAVEQDLRQASDAATSILGRRRACLDALAQTLIVRRVLEGAEVEAFLRTSGDSGSPIATSPARARFDEPEPTLRSSRTRRHGSVSSVAGPCVESSPCRS